MKKISLILPVYNVEEYIEKCLQSITAQTFQDYEVIIVDDGSTDGSVRFCEEICTQDSRFSLINKENGGLSDARNVGIEAATGEYIVFVDSDDFIAPTLLEQLTSCLEDTDSDIAICEPVHYYSERQYDNVNIFTDATTIRTFSSKEALCEMLYQKSFLVSAWGKAYKSSLFLDIRFPVGKLFEDSAIMYKLFEQCNQIVYTDAKLYAYVHRENSITTNEFSDRDLDILEITDDILEHFKTDTDVYRAAISYKVSACFRILLNAPDGDKYKGIQNDCKKFILDNWQQVLFDKNVRTKNKLALISITVFNPFVKFIYSKVNRWE